MHNTRKYLTTSRFISKRTPDYSSHTRSESIHQHHQPDPNQPKTAKTTPSSAFQRENHTAKRSTWKIKLGCRDDAVWNSLTKESKSLNTSRDASPLWWMRDCLLYLKSVERKHLYDQIMSYQHPSLQWQSVTPRRCKNNQFNT